MRYPDPGLAADSDMDVHLSRENRGALRGPISIERADACETMGERVLRLARAAAAMHGNESTLRLAGEWEGARVVLPFGSASPGPFPSDPRTSPLEDAS